MLSIAGPPAFRSATFSAEMDIEHGVVHASLTATTGAVLAATVVLDPRTNHAATTLTGSEVMEVQVTTLVLPLRDLCMSHLPKNCTRMDGATSAGASNGLLWSQRMPFGLSSPRPISVAAATSVLGWGAAGPAASGSSSGWRCTNTSDTRAGCTVPLLPGAPATLATAVVTNFDLCRTSAGCGDPIPAALAQATALAAQSDVGVDAHVGDETVGAHGAAPGGAVRQLQAANGAFWAEVWSNASVSLPGDALLEQFYYGTTYMIMSASREGNVAAGLWGPWVHSDTPGWEGDFTLDYNHEANHWGLYANNRLAAAWPQYQPLLDYVPKARTDASFYNCSGPVKSAVK